MTDQKPTAEGLARRLERVFAPAVSDQRCLIDAADLLREQAARIAELEAQVPTIKGDALREAAITALVHDQSSWLRYVKETDRAIIEQWLVSLANQIEKEMA